MNLFKNFILGLVAFITLILIVALFLPSTYHVERELELEGPKFIIVNPIIKTPYITNWGKITSLDLTPLIVTDTFPGNIGNYWNWTSTNAGDGRIKLIKLNKDSTEITYSIELLRPYITQMECKFSLKTNNYDDGYFVKIDIEGNLSYPFERYTKPYLEEGISKILDISIPSLEKYIIEDFKKYTLEDSLLKQETLKIVKSTKKSK